MRVLWVCNIMLPKIARALGRDAEPVGGWMSGLLDALEGSGTVIGVAYPSVGTETVQGMAGDTAYYSFCQPSPVLLSYDAGVEARLRGIIEAFQPDLLHIFGTEYVHSLAAVRAFGRPERTLIGIQGVLSAYAEHFMADVPLWVQKGRTFRDIVKRDNLIHQRESFLIRAKFEREALQRTGHVLGRTDWDKACTEQINPRARYHFGNEVLRDSFYESEWEWERCEKHSLFVSQGSYPIKGLHYVLKALPRILEHYPDAKVYVAGGDITKKETLQDRLRMSSYGKYICRLIEENGLEGHVEYTGFLDEAEMKERFLRSHVFVSPSSIENSPNSVGEAMLLGMPVVVSDVGGVKNLLTHEREGYLYQADAWYMIAYYVNKVFARENEIKAMGAAARRRAQATHSREENSRALLAVYEELMENGHASE